MKRRGSSQNAKAPRRALRICFAAIAVVFLSLLVSSGVRAAAEFTWTVAEESARTGWDAKDIFGRQPGSFAVGHSTQVLNVPGTLGENRPVAIHLWYPARLPDDCDNPGRSDGNGGDQGCSATPSVYTSRLYGVPLLPQWDPLSWTIGTGGAFENLPIVRQDRPFPVIIFSHGAAGSAIDSVYTLEALASFGFIVAAPNHMNDTTDDLRIDFINSQAQFSLIPCFDGLPSPCVRGPRAKSFTDRAHDVSAIIDALPTWFGDRVDISRVGVMGHSRGTVTALAAAGGSTTWGVPPDPRVKAIMGLASATAAVFDVDVQNVTVPALLVAGELDTLTPPAFIHATFDMLGSTEKEFVLIENAKHLHFASGFCAMTQSSGAIAAASTRAILDLHTIRRLVSTFGSLGVAMDYCGIDTFTTPNDIRPLVASLTGFNVTPTNVPTTGVDSTEVNEEVTELAVDFFGRVLERDQQ